MQRVGDVPRRESLVRLMPRRSLRRIDASPADVGRRVTLRYRTDALGMGSAEAVGVLDRWSGTGKDGVLRIRRRDDSYQRVPFGQVVAARVVPPELSAYRLQEYGEATWPALEYRDLGCWRMRWAGEHAGRANSVRVGGPPDRPLPAALKAVTEWYAERGGTALLQIPDPSAFDEVYEARGWPITRRSRLLTAATPRLLISTASARTRGDLALTLATEPDEEWLALLSGDDVGAQQEITPILTAPDTAVFVSCRRADSGELIGIGRGVSIGEWAAANNMVTIPAARGRGIATAVMAALIEWSVDVGASRWFLRVNSASEPALALYDGLGFSRHHDYVYRAPADAGSATPGAPSA